MLTPDGRFNSGSVDSSWRRFKVVEFPFLEGLSTKVLILFNVCIDIISPFANRGIPGG